MSLTVMDFMVNAMKIPPLEKPPIPLNGAHLCALTGQTITCGYKIWDVVPSAAGEFLDLLPNGIQPYVSETAARAFKGAWNLGSRMFIRDGDEWIHYHPLIARDTTGERPCWSDLIHTVKEQHWGKEAVIIIASDPKKRVFPKARVTVIGENSSIFVHDSDRQLSQIVNVSFSKLIDILGQIERIYSIHFPDLPALWGFSKSAMRTSILQEFNKANSYGLELAIEEESELSHLRQCPEFDIALIVAQKIGNPPEKQKKSESKPESQPQNQITPKGKGINQDDHHYTKQQTLF